ncbi:hypothetical protein F4778DRAFT_787598 [Xylariomycetidae sp. FL2044]|nr:hypothetical protein F4778DRAFT_787598 [Xylariomycetidae sp. FL2044]
MSGLKNGLTKDAHSSYSYWKLVLHWQDYFHTVTACPPIVYLDFWPFNISTPDYSHKCRGVLPAHSGESSAQGHHIPLGHVPCDSRTEYDIREPGRTPGIRSQLNVEAESDQGAKVSGPKTVISLALEEEKLQAVNEDTGGPDSKLLSQKSIDTVKEQLRHFISAGHDTTVQAINPSTLTHLRAELDRILGPIPDHDAAQEALRLYLLGSTLRRATPGFHFVFDDQGSVRYPMADGALVHTNPTIVHLRSDLWPRATEFPPERFICH